MMFIDNMQKWCTLMPIDCGEQCPMYDTVMKQCLLKHCPQQWEVTQIMYAYNEIITKLHESEK